MRRHTIRPYGSSVRPTRMLSLLLAVAVLWMLYGRLRDPATWRILLDAKDSVEEPVVPGGHAAETPETVVPGSNDQDENEVANLREMLQLVTDKTELKPREMHAYWRLMSWSRTATFSDLQQRARRDVPFTQFWEQPEKYRGQLATLRLHVRRVLEYNAPENPQHLAKTYEAWGWTDESRSFPYVVVFSELPNDLPLGTDIRGEVEFVGYFLKVMSYKAFETTRGAPLLVGRVRTVPRVAVPAAAPVDTWSLFFVVVGGSLLVFAVVWLQFKSRPAPRHLAVDEDAILLSPAGDTESVDNTADNSVPPSLADLADLDSPNRNGFR